MSHRARTLAMIRQLAAMGPLVPARTARRPLPVQQHPDLIIDGYIKTLLRVVVRPAQASAAVAQHHVLNYLAAHRRQIGKHDADDAARARAAIEQAGRDVAGAMRPTELHAVAEEFGKATSDFQRAQLDRQVRAAMGVSYSQIERPIRDLIPAFTSSNVELIVTVPDRYFERLRADVEEAFTTGMHPTTLAERFVQRDGMAENDAIRIARDQIGKLNGQFNQERQQSLGADSFVWRGMMDNRERDSHRDLEGETFQWDDPPVDAETGETITPGSAIQCRCYPEPVFDTPGDLPQAGDDEAPDAPAGGDDEGYWPPVETDAPDDDV